MGTDIEFRRDLAIGAPFSGQLRHLEFLWREFDASVVDPLSRVLTGSQQLGFGPASKASRPGLRKDVVRFSQVFSGL